MKDEYRLYDPGIFALLADWLQLMNTGVICGEDEILMKAERNPSAIEVFFNR